MNFGSCLERACIGLQGGSRAVYLSKSSLGVLDGKGSVGVWGVSPTFHTLLRMAFHKSTDI